MKKLIAVILCVLFLVSFAACSSGGDEATTTQSENEKTEAQKTESESKGETAPVTVPENIKTVVDKEEGKDYQSYVVEGKAEKHNGEKITKEGIFTSISDEYNGVTRYYVWGYNDDKKIDCWQWEIKVDDTKNLPENGSLVTMTGVLENSDKALDNVWFTDPEITVKEEYTGEKFDIDMSVMSPTLARVQVASIFTAKDKFEGKSVAVYCKVISESLIGHPTDDDSWQMHIHAKGKVPSEGTLTVASGVMKDGVLDKVKFN